MEKVTPKVDFLDAIKRYYLSPESQYLEHFLESETPFSIFNCFINLAIVEYEQQKQQEEQQLTVAKGHFRDDKISCYESIYEPQKMIDIADVFSEVEGQHPPYHILVSGRAGIGKTTFCQFIATYWAASCFDPLGDWIKNFTGIIWIPLRKLKELTDRMYLSAFIHAHCLSPSDQSKMAIAYVESDLNNPMYRWLFLLDGADEVLEEITNPKHPAYHLFSELKAKQDWILTSRPHQLTSRFLGKVRHLELTGFTWPNIEQYIQTFFETVGKEELAKNLLSNIKLNPNLRGIAHIPMQLELLCSIWQESSGDVNVVNMTLTQLYQKLIISLLRRYLNKQAIDAENFMDDEVLNHASVSPLLASLKKIAWQTFESNTLIFEVSKNQALLEPIETNKRDLLFDKMPLLKVTGHQKSNLIDKKYYFVHLTFQEFFVAWYIVEAIKTHKFPNPYDNLEQLLVKTLLNLRYEIVYWFVAGLLRAYAPEALENFFNLISHMRQYDLSSYSKLQTIRYQEEAHFYDFESSKFDAVNKDNVISSMVGKSKREALRLAHCLNASPSFCQAFAIEDKLIAALNSFWKNKQPVYLPILAFNTLALKDKSFNYLQALLLDQRYEKNWETILQLLFSLLNHYPKFAKDLYKEQLLKLLRHENFFLVQWIIKIAAFFTEVNEELIDFLINGIKNQRYNEVIIKPSLDTLLTFASFNKLTNRQKLKLKRVIFSCIVAESGWLLNDLATLLVTITDTKKEYSNFLKNLFNKSFPPNYPSNFRPDSQKDNQLSFTFFNNPIAGVLTALVKTEDVAISEYLLIILKKEVTKSGPKNLKIIENILCAFLNANYHQDDILSCAFSVIKNEKIPVIYKRMALHIISHTPKITSYIFKKLEKLYQGQNVLLKLACFVILVKHKQITVTNAEAIQKLITNLFYTLSNSSNFSSSVAQVRGEALNALDFFNLSHDNILQLLDALDLQDFQLDDSHTFKGALIRLLSKYINDHFQILNKLQELANDEQEQENYIYLANAFGALKQLPDSVAKKLLEWLSPYYVEKQEYAALIISIASTCKKFIRKGNYLHYLIIDRFKTAKEGEWLFLADFLAAIGELSVEDLKTLTHSYPNLAGENVLTIFGYSGATQLKILIKFLLPLLQQYEVQNFEAWSIYRVLRNFDLTDYLPQLGNHNANSYLLDNTPTKSLISTYISLQDENLLKIFHQRVFAQGLIVYYLENCLVWYEQNEYVKIQVSEGLFLTIKHRLACDLVFSANSLIDYKNNFPPNDKNSEQSEYSSNITKKITEIHQIKQGELIMEKNDSIHAQESSHNNLLIHTPLADSVVNLNQAIKAITLELEKTIKEIYQHPEKYELKQAGLCHVLIKALYDETDSNTLGQQLQRMNVSTFLREKDNQYGFSPFHWLMLKDDTKVSDYLATKGLRLDQRDKLGLLPTHWAAYFGKQKFLLHQLTKVTQFNEVEVEFVDATQHPPQKIKFVLNELHLAIMGRQLDPVQAIFNTFNHKHALINANIKTLGNLLHLIVYVSCHESPEQKSDAAVSAVELLQVVLRNFTADSIRDLLKQKEHNHEGLTPLILAAKYGQVSLLRELMTYLQVHVEQANSLQEIENAFYCAVHHGQIDVVEVLLHYYHFKPNIQHKEFKKALLYLQQMKDSDDPKSTYYEAIDNMIDTVSQQGYFSAYEKPEAKTQAYKNLVLSGGGGKGFALPYLLQAFKQHCDYRREQVFNPLAQEILSYEALQRVVGTSAGAIFAMALAVGHSPEDIITQYYDYDFAEFLETDRIKALVKAMDAPSSNKLSVLNQVLEALQINLQKVKALLKKTQSNHPVMGAGFYALTHPKALYDEIKTALQQLEVMEQNFQGFCTGEKALAFIRKLVTDQELPVDLTLGELAKLVSQDPKRYKHLHVVVTNSSKGTFEVLSSENAIYKDYLIVDAVRASMSYPIVFAPHHLTIKRNGVLIKLQDEYIDGGVLRNFAIDEFDFKQYIQTQWVGDPRYPELNKETLGFRFEVLETEAQAAIETSAPNNVVGRVKALVSIYAEAESLINAYVDRDYGRSIAIDTNPITTFTFKRLDEQDKAQLKQTADNVVAAYFQQELPKEKSQIEDLSNPKSAKDTYQIQSGSSKNNFFQDGKGSNVNLSQANNNNDTNTWINYSASDTDTQREQSPYPK